MKRDEIIERLTSIFRTVFNNPELELNNDMTAEDVETWDSLTNMIMITQVEDSFGIKFKLRELNKLKKVGDLVEIVESRV